MAAEESENCSTDYASVEELSKEESAPISVDTAREIAVQALALTVQDWRTLGQGNDPSVSENAIFDTEGGFDVAVDRVTSLLVVRVVAIQKQGTIQDTSTSGLCRLALITDGHPWGVISSNALEELRIFVRRMLSGYSSELPFHNPQHATAVIVSCNKLLDMMLSNSFSPTGERQTPTYGLRGNPLLLAALMFSALFHDVKHKGVKNSRLSQEGDPIALLYNDRSIQEKNSLHFAFSELLKPAYESLRDAMFSGNDDNYRHFRNAVISTVMSTDLTCPEQTSLTKSKWKEAFPPPVTLTRPRYRRGSVNSHLSKQEQRAGYRNRRGSECSEMSDVTTDIGWHAKIGSPNRSPRRSSMGSVTSPISKLVRRSSTGASPDKISRRLSVGSNYQRWIHRRQLSINSFESGSDDYCADSVAMMRKPKAPVEPRHAPPRTESESTKESYAAMSFSAESIGINHKRLEGGKVTRSRLLSKRRVERKPSTSSRVSTSSFGGSQLSVRSNSESSISVTPPSSDDEYCGQVVAGVSSVPLQQSGLQLASSSAMIDFRRNSISERPPEEASRRGSLEYGRRDSASAMGFAKRLGIRRSIDFSGEAIEVYHNKRGSLGAMSALSGDEEPESVRANGGDEMDLLKASALMEALLRTSDVGHFFQSWENMTHWTSRMFAELHRASKAGRGSDPSLSWFDNQVKVMDLYLTPLALQLEESGVFGDQNGPMFADIVDEIKARWLVYGYSLTQQLQKLDFTDGSASGFLSESSQRSSMFDLSDHTSVI